MVEIHRHPLVERRADILRARVEASVIALRYPGRDVGSLDTHELGSRSRAWSQSCHNGHDGETAPSELLTEGLVCV